MLKRVTLCLLLVLVCVVTAQSHPGRTDSNGGHYDRKNGGYHFHGGGSSGASSPKRPSVPRFEPTILAPGYEKLRSRSEEKREAATPDETLDDLKFESKSYRVIDSRKNDKRSYYRVVIDEPLNDLPSKARLVSIASEIVSTEEFSVSVYLPEMETARLPWATVTRQGKVPVKVTMYLARTPTRFLSAAAAARVLRTWSDATGSYSVEASLESYFHGQVFLTKPDGIQTRLPLDRLSAPDQAFVLEVNDIKALYGRVVAVTDGDTIKVLDGENEQHTIRLDGIDAPESGQDFGTQSKKRLSDLVFGKDVRVEWRDRDRYGRTLGSIFAGGVAVNLLMVKDGMAWHYKQYSDDEILARAEMDARARKVGLWRDPNPIPPWEFRRPPSATAPATPAIAPSPPVTAVASPDAREATVYVTKSGTKYHRGNCRHVAKSKIPIDLVGAKARYGPCSVCNPPE